MLVRGPWRSCDQHFRWRRRRWKRIRNKNTSAEFLRSYDDACELEVGHELRKSVELQKRFYTDPDLIDFAIGFVGRNRTVRTLITRFGIGQLSYEELKARTLIEALPGYLGYQTEKLRHRIAQRYPRAAQWASSTG
jgi:hypothetical protein